MNMKLYTPNNAKMDRYGYFLQEIAMDYSYGESFLVYRYIDVNDRKNEIAIPTLNEVVIKNKNILRTAIELMHIFPEQKLDIISQLPNLLVAHHSTELKAISKNEDYLKIIEDKTNRYYEDIASENLNA